MKVEVVKVGFLECNCYVVSKGNDCLVIDPGDELDKIVKLIGEKKVKGILITHNHFDHVGCVDSLSLKYNVKIYDYNNLDEGVNSVDKFKFEVIYTFGHTMDSVSYYFRDDKIMFTGDFLFKDTVGRCDLDGGNYNLMLDSIKKIKKYDDDIIIYPGHGEFSTLGDEKKNNSYFM